MSLHGGWGYEWECTPESCSELGHPEYTEAARLKALELAKTDGPLSLTFKVASDEYFRAVVAQTRAGE